jgi:hypothetical protein
MLNGKHTKKSYSGSKIENVNTNVWFRPGAFKVKSNKLWLQEMTRSETISAEQRPIHGRTPQIRTSRKYTSRRVKKDVKT